MAFCSIFQGHYGGISDGDGGISGKNMINNEPEGYRASMGATPSASRPNETLRRFRQARRMSQDELVKALREAGWDGCDRRTVQRYESGIISAPRWTARRALEQVFGVPVSDLGFLPPGEEEGPQTVNDHASCPSVAPQDIVRACSDVDSRPSPVTVVRQRQASAQSGALLGIRLDEEISVTAQESAWFVRRAGRSVGAELIDQLDADTALLAVEFLHRPPYSVFRLIADLRREVFDLIEQHPRPGLLRDLYRICGQLSALLSHASSDLGQFYAAESNARTAWLCGDLSGDGSIIAYTRWLRSNMAYWRGEYREAAQIADPDRAPHDDCSNRLRLASQRARALAAAEDRPAADRALGQATDLRDRMSSERPEGVFHFAPGKAAYYASETRIAMGGRTNHHLAVVQAVEALQLFEAAPESDRSPELVAAAHLDLVTAHLALDDQDAVRERIPNVLDLPAENRTVPIISRMARIRHRLAVSPDRKAPTVMETIEQIDLFRAYPAARALPREEPLK